MAKKKCNKKNTPNNKSRASWLEKLITTIAVLAFAWILIASFFTDGKLGLVFWIAAAFLLAKLIISGVMGRSFTYYVKKLLKKFNEWKASHADDDDDDYEDVDDDDDDVIDLPEHLELVNDVNADGKPVSVIALKKEYCPADLVPTLVYVKSADGKHEVPMTVLKKPLKPADIPADKKVSALNIAIPKAPAKVKCSTAGCTGEGLPGKHCPECGAKFVAAAPKEVKCSKPGCTGKGLPGKHCPECGNKLS